MTTTHAHRRLAEKFMHKPFWPDVLVPDSMRALTVLAFSEEEAELVNALSFATLPPLVIARRVRRPVGEVRPLLESLAERLLITEITITGVRTYGFLNFFPGMYEAQMIRAKDARNDAEREFYRRFAELYHEFYDEMLAWLKPTLEGKKLQITRIIPVNRAIEISSGVVPALSDQFAEMVDRNNSFCLVNICSCRHEMELLGQGCGKPMDVCSVMGRLADYCIEKGLARRVEKQEFIDAKTRAAEAGLVNFADNQADPMQICSCCSCCCAGLRGIKQFNMPTLLAASQVEATVDEAACDACGKCAKACPMDAIAWTKKQPPVKIDPVRCIGCGICVTRCDKKRALTLRERPDHSAPSATVMDYLADRYLEIKDNDVALGPRLQLSFGRLLARLSPVSLGGPGYHPPDK